MSIQDPTVAEAASTFIVGFRATRLGYVAAKLGPADLLRDDPQSPHQLARVTSTPRSRREQPDVTVDETWRESPLARTRRAARSTPVPLDPQRPPGMRPPIRRRNLPDDPILRRTPLKPHRTPVMGKPEEHELPLNVRPLQRNALPAHGRRARERLEALRKVERHLARTARKRHPRRPLAHHHRRHDPEIDRALLLHTDRLPRRVHHDLRVRRPVAHVAVVRDEPRSRP